MDAGLIGASTARPSTSPARAWLVSPAWDSFWLLSGLWLLGIGHWLVALALASTILGSQAPAGRRVPATVRRLVPSGMVMWLLVLTLISVAMFVVFRAPLFHGVVGVLAPGLAGAYFGISFVHFAYDRFLYAFGRPEIRAWVSPHPFSPTRVAR